MENNKILNDVLSKLPKESRITYVKKTTPQMPTPYILTVEGYSKFYLNSDELPELTPEEQLILINSNNRDPIFTPQKVIAAIFKSREIKKRSKNDTDALHKCNDILVKENRDLLDARSEASNEASKRAVFANKLEYYLNNENIMEKYNKVQASKLSLFINLKNRFEALIKRKPYIDPPVSDEELQEGRNVWEEFRNEQNAPDSMTNTELLKQYRYNSSTVLGRPFEFLTKTPEIESLAEEYAITILSLQILDGSALKKAESQITKNSFQYLNKFKSKTQSKENR